MCHQVIIKKPSEDGADQDNQGANDAENAGDNFNPEAHFNPEVVRDLDLDGAQDAQRGAGRDHGHAPPVQNQRDVPQ